MGRRRMVLAGLVVGAVVLSGCQLQVVRDGAGLRLTHPDPGFVMLWADHGTGIRNQEVAWSPSVPVESHATECATWWGDAGTAMADEGMAFDITVQRSGTRMVTISRNAYPNDLTTFSVRTWFNQTSHLWGTVDLTQSLGTLVMPLGWPIYVCARMTRSSLQFVAGHGYEPPAWGAPGQGGTIAVPGADSMSGVTGIFVGHVPVGTADTMSAITVDGRPALP